MKATAPSLWARAVRWAVMAGAAGLLAASASGCYQRVVGAQGFGADSVATSNPNVESSRGPRTLGYPTYRPRKMPGS